MNFETCRNMFLYVILIVGTLTVTSFSAKPKEFSARLSGGSAAHEGFLEIVYYGKWMQVSNAAWDIRNSIVLCRQLGYLDVDTESKRISNYISDLRFFETNFHCQGSEASLADCERREIKNWKVHCKTGKEVWVSCSDKQENVVLKPTPSKSSGEIDHFPVRLRDKSSNQEEPTARGVLEVGYKGKWYQVCSNGWTDENSFVACGHLGYTTDVKNNVVDDVKYRRTSFHLMKNVNCTGSESSLLSCEHAGFRRHYGCKKSVVLSCKSSPMDTKEQRYVRLRGGQRKSEGRVEVFMQGQWGTICHKNWDLTDANVVCKQLGYGTAIQAVRSAGFGQGTVRVMLSDVNCTGAESGIHSCKYKLPDESCKHYKDAAVRCNYPLPQINKVRIRNGPSRFEGRVEVLRRGRWYAVCGVYFTEKDGDVVCRELGLGFIEKAYSTWNYGITRIGIYEPRCKGDEESLFKCNHRPWFKGSCRYYDMASVKCSNGSPDILMDIKAMRPSIKINTWHLRDLMCSMSENCLARTAYARTAFYDPKASTRRLMVFTSRILNKGTTAFRPNRHKDEWEWHECHKHYHSMEYFAQYDVIDFNGKRVAEGHKASFCLEDTGCDSGEMKMYNCTDKGDQGISVGCADNYSNAIDCQWVDVTDVKDGNYSLMVHLNPNGAVRERDYGNNVATCEIHYFDSQVKVGRCSNEPCEQRSYGGTGYGMCCHFPFTYNGTKYDKCITDNSDSPWCATTFDFNADNKWGYCKETIEDTRELSINKRRY